MSTVKAWAIQWDDAEKSITLHYTEDEAKFTIQQHNDAGGTGDQTIVALAPASQSVEVARLKALVKAAESPGGGCPWCGAATSESAKHAASCSAFTPDGEVR